jgi:hypothetical protein
MVMCVAIRQESSVLSVESNVDVQEVFFEFVLHPLDYLPLQATLRKGTRP